VPVKVTNERTWNEMKKLTVRILVHEKMATMLVVWDGKEFQTYISSIAGVMWNW
jgi:hypothetical protein